MVGRVSKLPETDLAHTKEKVKGKVTVAKTTYKSICGFLTYLSATLNPSMYVKT